MPVLTRKIASASDVSVCMPLGSWLEFVAVASWLAACGGGAHVRTPPSVTAITPLPAQYDPCFPDAQRCATGNVVLVSQSSTASAQSEILLTGPLAAAPSVGKRSDGLLPQIGQAVASSPKSAPRAPRAIPTRAPSERAFIDMEATLSVETSDIKAAAASARALSAQAGGQVMNENFQDSEWQSGFALSIRVPADRAEWLLEELKKLGSVRAFESKLADLSRKWVDANSLLRSLEAARVRYEALLQSATNTAEMTEIEKELERVRTAIDRVHTDLEWMRDRVERSTLYLTLSKPAGDRITREAKLYPGLRLPFAFDARPDGESASYVGGGVSVLIARPFNFDLDLMTNTDSDARSGVDLLTTTVGVELYSNLLGGGRRKLFNPYFGFRAGYANLDGDDAVALGGSLGLELVKTEFFFVDLQTRVYALVATDRGTDVLFQPAAAFNFAY